MSTYINSVLIILACPSDTADNRLGEIIKLCKIFGQNCTNRGMAVDILDLYSEKEFIASDYLPSNNSKVLEYQIRLSRANLVVFFHPVILDSVPAVLKGFLDNVFISGFAYRQGNRIPKGLLESKQSLVFAFDSKSKWQSKLAFGDQLGNFWKKSIFDFVNLSGKLFVTHNFRSADNKTLELWQRQIIKISNNLKIKPSVIDF